MEWMYDRRNEIDRDSYLLGKSIDANFVEIEEEEKKKRRRFRKPLNDFKLQEDPLNMIEIKKSEFKQELLRNPLKMRKMKAKLSSNSKNDHDKDNAINSLDIKILKKWKKLRKLCFYFQNIPLEEFAMTLFRNKRQVQSIEAPKTSKLPYQAIIKLDMAVPQKSKDESLDEMKRNAEWNYNQRKKVLRENCRDDDNEAENKSENFIQPILSDFTKSNTLGDRINQNKNYIQRNTSDFKSDFMKNGK